MDPGMKFELMLSVHYLWAALKQCQYSPDSKTWTIFDSARVQGPVKNSGISQLLAKHLVKVFKVFTNWPKGAHFGLMIHTCHLSWSDRELKVILSFSQNGGYLSLDQKGGCHPGQDVAGWHRAWHEPGVRHYYSRFLTVFYLAKCSHFWQLLSVIELLSCNLNSTYRFLSYTLSIADR